MKVLINDTYHNEEDAKVSIFDRGYNFGDGVYEVVRFYRGKLFKFKAHYDRYKRSAEEIGIRFIYPEDKMKSEWEFLIADSGFGSGYIYTQISRGTGKRDHLYVNKTMEPQYVAYAVQEEERPLAVMETGMKVIVTEDIRWKRCDIKSLNLLGSVMAKNQAAERGAKEAVLCRDGWIAEGSVTNVFVVKDGVLYTHPVDDYILNGITRNVIIDKADRLGIPVKEERFTADFFMQADEAFTTATISEIMPIVAYECLDPIGSENGVLGSGKPGDITIRLHREFSREVE